MDGPTPGFNLSPSINCSILLENWEKYRVYTHFNFREEQIFQGGVFFPIYGARKFYTEIRVEVQNLERKNKEEDRKFVYAIRICSIYIPRLKFY